MKNSWPITMDQSIQRRNLRAHRAPNNHGWSWRRNIDPAWLVWGSFKSVWSMPWTSTSVIYSLVCAFPLVSGIVLSCCQCVSKVQTVCGHHGIGMMRKNYERIYVPMFVWLTRWFVPVRSLPKRLPPVPLDRRHASEWMKWGKLAVRSQTRKAPAPLTRMLCH